MLKKLLSFAFVPPIVMLVTFFTLTTVFDCNNGSITQVDYAYSVSQDGVVSGCKNFTLPVLVPFVTLLLTYLVLFFKNKDIGLIKGVLYGWLAILGYILIFIVLATAGLLPSGVNSLVIGVWGLIEIFIAVLLAKVGQAMLR